MNAETIPYHLRPNKAVDRQLLIDFLGRVHRFRDVSKYTYVGFGGHSLEDMRLMHAVFGSRKLISLETSDRVFKRQKFNRPFSCIRCLNVSSGEFIADYNVRGNAAIWLDYPGAKEMRVYLQEIQSLLTKMRGYDVIKVTLNATPDTLHPEIPKMSGHEVLAKRLEILQERLSGFLPATITAEDMTKNRLPAVLLAAFNHAARSIMLGIPDLVFQPVTAFAYADSQQQMLTTTAILLPKDPKDFFLATGLKSWEHFDAEGPRKIVVPDLTMRERLFIDRNLPRRGEKWLQQRLSFLFDDRKEKSLEMLRSYIKFYRQYPYYSRVLV